MKKYACFPAFLGLIAPSVFGVEVTFTAIDDSTLIGGFSSDANGNFGGRSELIAGDVSGNGRHMIMRWDVSSLLGIVDTVESITVELDLVAGGRAAPTKAQTATVQLISETDKGWVEGSGTNATNKVGVTWDLANATAANVGTSWSGGAGLAGSTTVANVGTLNILGNEAQGDTISVTLSGTDLTALIAGWADDEASSSGLFFRDDAANSVEQVFFVSNESDAVRVGASGAAARLIVDYTPVGPDTDGDGLPDDYEERFPDFLNPNVSDADQDVDRVGGLLAGALTPDGLTNEEERLRGTDPTNPDSDGDTLLDGDEVNIYGTDPLVGDSDGDNISDGEEVIAGADGYITDPNKKDTDGDMIDDDVEVASASDPTNILSPAPAPLPSVGLVALYTFDEGEGTVALDSAIADGAQEANQNQGSIGWTPTGLIGGALDLNGNSSLQAPDALASGTTAFTQTAWVYPRTRGGYKGIYSTRVLNGNPNFNWGLNVERNPLNGDLRFATGDATTGSSAGIDTPGIPADQWSHLAITWTTDGATATGNGYLNGLSIGTITTGLNPVYFTGAPYNIGDDPCCGGREFDGLIDEVSVWNVALSDAEIRSVFLRGLAGVGIPPSGPIDFRVTALKRNPDGRVTLTWNSHPFLDGTPDIDKPTYTVWFSDDLAAPLNTWADDSDDVLSMGDTTVYTTGNSFTGQPKVFFYVELNTPNP